MSPATTAASCGKAPLVGRFQTPEGVCPSLNTQNSRDFFRSTSVPLSCNNCTATVLDACEYQLEVTDARCGSSYKVNIAQSPAWPIGMRMGAGERISGPGRVAIDSVTASGSSTSDACSPLANAAEMAGHWCIVMRGACSAETQVRNCLGQDSANPHGVLGVIVVDSALTLTSGASLAPISFPLRVPLLMISRADGDRLVGSFSSTLFTISKAIGSASYRPFPPAGLLTREQRLGTVYGDNSDAPRPTAYRFFVEPNRLLGWAFGMQAADGSTTNVGLFALSDTLRPVLLRQWTYAQVGLSASLDWSPSSLIFGQQFATGSFFWLIGEETEFRFWNVADAMNPQFLAASIPRHAGAEALMDRSASHLWIQIPARSGESVQEWRYQQAWNIGNLTLPPRLLGAFALDTSLYTLGRGGTVRLTHPSFDSWGSNIVSFNLGDNGVAFYNYTDPSNVVLTAHRDSSLSSCSPRGVGGPLGAIVSGPEPHTWFACQPWEPEPLWTCAQGRINVPNATANVCDPTPGPELRYDFVAYRILPDVPARPPVAAEHQCEDGAIVNMFFERQSAE